MLTAATETLTEKLGLIDAIQRLGLSYHFESEIDEILKEVHANPPCFINGDKDDDLNLCTVALWFRLLRQQGYSVSCGTFSLDVLQILQFFFVEKLTSATTKVIFITLIK